MQYHWLFIVAETHPVPSLNLNYHIFTMYFNIQNNERGMTGRKKTAQLKMDVSLFQTYIYFLHGLILNCFRN